MPSHLRGRGHLVRFGQSLSRDDWRDPDFDPDPDPDPDPDFDFDEDAGIAEPALPATA